MARIRRRDVLAGLATGLAGAVAAPGVAARTPAPRAPAPQAPAPETPAQGLLDHHRRALLERLADQIVPGAGPAGVAALLDRVMAVEPASAQRRFLNALGAFDREARDRHARGWLEITGDQQADILRAASTLAPARPAPPPWTRGQSVERKPSPSAPANLRDHFDHVKDWVMRAYATTPPGLKELGFTGRMAFPAFPGCTHQGNDHR